MTGYAENLGTSAKTAAKILLAAVLEKCSGIPDRQGVSNDCEFKSFAAFAANKLISGSRRDGLCRMRQSKEISIHSLLMFSSMVKTSMNEFH